MWHNLSIFKFKLHLRNDTNLFTECVFEKQNKLNNKHKYMHVDINVCVEFKSL